MIARRTIDCLVEFCIEQRDAFVPCDWIARDDIDSETLSLAAKYLSMTSWYGYQEELGQIAEQGQPCLVDSLGLHREAQAIGFDLPYFSAKLRSGIALSKAPAGVAAEGQRAEAGARSG